MELKLQPTLTVFIHFAHRPDVTLRYVASVIYGNGKLRVWYGDDDEDDADAEFEDFDHFEVHPDSTIAVAEAPDA